MKIKKNKNRSLNQIFPDVLLAGSKVESQSDYEKHSVNFDFDAFTAHQVCVAGTFNDWNSSQLKLKRDPLGTWRGSFPVKPGAHQYRFFVDGAWAANPQAHEQIPNAFGGMNVVLNAA